MLQADNGNQRWLGIDLSHLPKTVSDAKAIGSPYFLTEERCAHGHAAPRYTKGGRCVDCSMFASASRHGFGYQTPSKRMIGTIERIRAAANGQKYYTPSKPCKNGHRLRWVASNNCVECDAAATIKHKEAIKERRLVKEYGIDLAARDAIAESQNHTCPICESKFADTVSVHIDHCHATGKVRGLLCGPCNQAIGLLKEDLNAIRRAARYIEDAAA